MAGVSSRAVSKVLTSGGFTLHRGSGWKGVQWCQVHELFVGGASLVNMLPALPPFSALVLLAVQLACSYTDTTNSVSSFAV